jgi:hypothetical protein
MELLIAPFLFSGLALKIYNNSKKKLLNKKSSTQNLLYSNFFTQSFTKEEHSHAQQTRKETRTCTTLN